MAEHVVARVGELKPGDRKIVTVGRMQIGVFRIGDLYYALPNICVHQFGPLCEGEIRGAIFADASTGWLPEVRYEGEIVSCPWHGREYRITTGESVRWPAVRLRLYPVKVDGDYVKLVV